ncbi:MAG TPA: gliding motility lipoprotein GldD [Prolixibacteraceae bacterium]|nr:gliding motility lipoprotein GldD [Prolixibacteraceae bacterium]
MMRTKLSLLILLVAMCISGCKEKYTPKPSGYFRIQFPEKNYQKLAPEYPFCFEYPTYARVEKDSSKMAEPYWINICADAYNVKFHLSYKPIKGNLAELAEESRDLVYKHSIKANTINEKIFTNPDHNVYGTIYELKGNTASPYQFYLTDSTTHFLRGSFYISEIPNYDSLYPVIVFFEEDIKHMIETFTWK